MISSALQAVKGAFLMTDEQKKEIQRLKNSGAGYKKIAEETGISINTIKTFCRRKILAEKTNDGKQPCMRCGKS